MGRVASSWSTFMVKSVVIAKGETIHLIPLALWPRVGRTDYSCSIPNECFCCKTEVTGAVFQSFELAFKPKECGN